MRSAKVCSSVEGETLELQCRKFSVQQPRRHPDLGKVIHPFKISIHGYARVVKPYLKPYSAVGPNDGSTPLRQQSMLILGDEIHGEAVDGYGQKPIGRPEVRHATASHKATFVKVRGGYAHVEISVRDHLSSAAIGQETPTTQLAIETK